MYDTILVPTDGSDHSVRAAEHARYLAELFDGTIHVVSVCDVAGQSGLFNAGGVDDEYVERLEEEAEVAIDTVLGVIGEDAPVETAIVHGTAKEGLLDYVDSHDVDIVAMGTHGRTGVSRYVTGSVTESVVRHAPVPVLTVRSVERSRVEGSYDELLIPTDGSGASDPAVDHGIEIARRADARVHAVNVVNEASMSAVPDYSLPTNVLEDLAAAGETAAEEIADRAREAGLEARATVRHGSPGWELLEYTEEFDIDLVTMGTAGLSGIDRVLLGSTTERVIRRADVPVVAVNTAKGAGD